MKLSILIPTIEKRKHLLEVLLMIIDLECRAVGWNDKTDYEVLINNSETSSIGEKRQQLLNYAKGKYTAAIDDDDWITGLYFRELKKGIDQNVDCVSLRGIMTTNGENPEVFEHSTKYKAYHTVKDAQFPEVKYLRFPNHLNCIKSSISKQFSFQKINHGEDTDWATQIFKSGLIKTEYYSPKIIYLYRYQSKK